jgi:hypothetical protein
VRPFDGQFEYPKISKVVLKRFQSDNANPSGKTAKGPITTEKWSGPIRIKILRWIFDIQRQLLNGMSITVAKKFYNYYSSQSNIVSAHSTNAKINHIIQ